MKKNLLLMVALVMLSFGLNAQSILELKADKAEVAKQIGTKKAELATLESQAAALQSKIDKLSGWQTGFGGNIGFNLSDASNWIKSNPNSNSSSSGLSLAFNGFANKIQDKYEWRNTLTALKAYQDVDFAGEAELLGDVKDGLFSKRNSIADNILVNSLFGYKFAPKWLASIAGTLDTSFGNFFDPAKIDLGVGATWVPNSNFMLMVHPLNYNFQIRRSGDVEGGQTSLGVKLRAEYNNNFKLAGKAIAVSSILDAFQPYSGDTTSFSRTLDNGTVENWDATSFNYLWMNNFSFNLWGGIGANLGLGLRYAGTEINETQTLTTFGLGYTF